MTIVCHYCYLCSTEVQILKSFVVLVLFHGGDMDTNDSLEDVFDKCGKIPGESNRVLLE